MPVIIRRATAADSPALSHICLLTADAGVSAETLHKAGELPGIVYSVPYVHLPEAFGYVLVDNEKADDKFSGVVGYVVAAYDTRAYEKAFRDVWLPLYLAKYPLSSVDAEPTTDTPEYLRDLLPDDKQYICRIHTAETSAASDDSVAFSPAHMHINILPEYQRQGWGRKLIGQAVKHLKENGLNGLWLGLHPKNTNARKFYSRVGFEQIPNA